MWYSEWLCPDYQYLEHWPLECLSKIVLERAIFLIKKSRTRILNFTQDIVGYSGRVNWCLGAFNTTIYGSLETSAVILKYPGTAQRIYWRITYCCVVYDSMHTASSCRPECLRSFWNWSSYLRMWREYVSQSFLFAEIHSW